jgi:hypothetical protein
VAGLAGQLRELVDEVLEQNRLAATQVDDFVTEPAIRNRGT